MANELDLVLEQVRREPGRTGLWIEALRLAPRLDRVEATVAALVAAGALEPSPGADTEALEAALYAAGWGLGDPFWHLAGPPRPASVSARGERAAFASLLHGIRIVGLASGRVEARLALDRAQALAFPPGARSLVAARYDPDAGLALARWQEGAPALAARVAPPRGAAFDRVLDLAPCGGAVALAGAKGQVGIGLLSPWSRPGAHPSLRLVVRDRRPGAASATFSPDLRFVLVDRMTLRAPRSQLPTLYDLDSGGGRELDAVGPDTPASWTFSPEGQWLAALTPGKAGSLHLAFHPLHAETVPWHVELPGELPYLSWTKGGKAESPGHALDPLRRRATPRPVDSGLRLLVPDPLPGSTLPRIRDRLSGCLAFAPRYHAAPITGLRLVGRPPVLESTDLEGTAVRWCLTTGRCLSRGPAGGRVAPAGPGPAPLPAPCGTRLLVAEDGCIRLRPRT